MYVLEEPTESTDGVLAKDHPLKVKSVIEGSPYKADQDPMNEGSLGVVCKFFPYREVRTHKRCGTKYYESKLDLTKKATYFFGDQRPLRGQRHFTDRRPFIGRRL